MQISFVNVYDFFGIEPFVVQQLVLVQIDKFFLLLVAFYDFIDFVFVQLTFFPFEGVLEDIFAAITPYLRNHRSIFSFLCGSC